MDHAVVDTDEVIPIPSPADPTVPEIVPVAVRQPRLLNLQILRACAASMVVVEHSIGELTFWHHPMTNYIVASEAAGGIGVISFFLLSGFIMARQSMPLFREKWGSLTFAYDRIIRIVPLYWLATLLWYWSYVHGRATIPKPRAQLAYSLLFLPNLADVKDLLHPIVGQGWTLNYEMAFYFILTICLLLPARFGIPALIVAIVSLVSIVHSLNPFGSTSAGLIWNFYTDMVMILFAIGALIGYFEPRIARLGRIHTAISPAFLIVLPPAILLALGFTTSTAGTWYAVASFALVLVPFCAFSNPVRVGWITRALVLLGDASYSTYLSHVWAITFVFPIAVKAYAHFHANLEHPAVFIVACVVAANLLGVAVHLILERPITKALRNLRGRVLTHNP